MRDVPQVIVFTYHKTGTVLFQNILARIAAAGELTLAQYHGMVAFVPAAPALVLLSHSLLGALPARDFRAIRLIRDPRDIWLSGYLYHRRCTEAWCVGTDFDPTPPIVFPRVPAAFQHRRERWKRDYLARLGGRSYQHNLLERSRDDGMAFELDGYTGVSLETMRAWPHRDPRILDVRLEDIAADFDGTMRVVFTHLGLPVELVDLAAAEDVGRMTDAAVAENPHIESREPSRWRTELSAAQVGVIEGRFGDLILGLGYRKEALLF